MANTNVPIPGSPLIFFFFITLGYLIFTLFSIQSAKSIDSIDKAKDGSMLTIIYVCILIIGSYFINTTVSKALCSSQAVRWTDILLATLLPWIIIFFTLFIVLKIFPGWVTPFSNTVGYLVISILGVETTLTAILNNNTNVNGDLAKAIANITHNKSNFINQIDINKTTFLNFIDELKKVGIIDLNKPEDEVTQQGGGPALDAIGPHMAKGLEIRESAARQSAAQEAEYKREEEAEAAAARVAAGVAPPASGAAFQKAARGAPAEAKPPGDDNKHIGEHYRTSPGKHRRRDDRTSPGKPRGTHHRKLEQPAPAAVEAYGAAAAAAAAAAEAKPPGDHRKLEQPAPAARAAEQEAQAKRDEKAQAPPASGAAFDKAARGAPAEAKPPAEAKLPAEAKPPGDDNKHIGEHYRTSPGKHRRRDDRTSPGKHRRRDDRTSPGKPRGTHHRKLEQPAPAAVEAYGAAAAAAAAAAETNVGKEVRAQLKPELQGDDSRPPHTILEQGALDKAVAYKPRQAERSTTELLMPGAPSLLADAGQRDERQRDAAQGKPGQREAAQGEAGQGEAAEQDNTKPENNPDIQNLYKLLVIKNVIGQLTWYTLAGVLVCSVSYNYIINMSCEKSLEEITADLNNAEAESLEYAQESG
jgi:hypothetical protein